MNLDDPASPARAHAAAASPRACLDSLASATAMPRVLIIAAHPDDETIGAASRLPLAGGGTLLHVTNGAPRNLADARREGLASMDAYAAVRRSELMAALRLAGFPPQRAHTLEVVDQEASLQLSQITRAVMEHIEDCRPGVVLTHAYEGGHPDHDATAFAVHAACALLRARTGAALPLLEFACYHGHDGHLETGKFLPGAAVPEHALVLSPAQRALKAAMMECFRTQRSTLALFGHESERFRVAPAYDFAQPPHPGTLHYERYDWGMSAREFVRHARDALRALDLDRSCL